MVICSTRRGQCVRRRSGCCRRHDRRVGSRWNIRKVDMQRIACWGNRVARTRVRCGRPVLIRRIQIWICRMRVARGVRVGRRIVCRQGRYMTWCSRSRRDLRSVHCVSGRAACPRARRPLVRYSLLVVSGSVSRSWKSKYAVILNRLLFRSGERSATECSRVIALARGRCAIHGAWWWRAVDRARRRSAISCAWWWRAVRCARGRRSAARRACRRRRRWRWGRRTYVRSVNLFTCQLRRKRRLARVSLSIYANVGGRGRVDNRNFHNRLRQVLRNNVLGRNRCRHFTLRVAARAPACDQDPVERPVVVRLYVLGSDEREQHDTGGVHFRGTRIDDDTTIAVTSVGVKCDRLIHLNSNPARCALDHFSGCTVSVVGLVHVPRCCGVRSVGTGRQKLFVTNLGHDTAGENITCGVDLGGQIEVDVLSDSGLCQTLLCQSIPGNPLVLGQVYLVIDHLHVRVLLDRTCKCTCCCLAVAV